MASIKEVLHYLIEKNILVKNDSGQYVLGEYGYIHLEEEQPTGQPKSASIHVEKLAVQLRQIFPGGIKPGGIYVRSSLNAIERKLAQFHKKFPQYTQEQILKATQAYVNELGKTNYNYMKTAEYFILKDHTSTLETWINNMEEEDTPQVQQEAVRGKVV